VFTAPPWPRSNSGLGTSGAGTSGATVGAAAGVVRSARDIDGQPARIITSAPTTPSSSLFRSALVVRIADAGLLSYSSSVPLVRGARTRRHSSVFHGERFCLQMIISGCSRLQKSLQGGFAAVCNSANEYDGVAPGGEGGPSWVSMRFGHGDGATSRDDEERHRARPDGADQQSAQPIGRACRMSQQRPDRDAPDPPQTRETSPPARPIGGTGLMSKGARGNAPESQNSVSAP
jgi:hypothetical protein